MNGKAFSRSVLLLTTSILGPYIQAQSTGRPAPAQPPACLQPVASSGALRFATGAPVLTLRHGEGSASIPITNHGDSPLTLDLAAQVPTECTSQAALDKSKVTVTVPDQAKTLAPNATASISVAVTGITEASVATVLLQNAGVSVGSVALVELDAPLNITLATTDATLDYSYNEPVSVTLKNGDPYPYHVQWSFLIEGFVISSDLVDLPANGTATIRLKHSCGSNAGQPFCQGYSFVDPIHPTLKPGVLRLALLGPSAFPQGLLPSRTLPLTLVMRRVGPTTSLLLSYGYAAFVLLLGGVLSFLASSVLPVMQRKGSLRAQLQEIANRTSTVSIRVDSYLRVLLRLERKRIEAAIAAASPWVPSSDDPLTRIAGSMDTLVKRLAAAERLDELRRKHDQISGAAPPSVTDNIDLILQAAADQLHSTTLDDTELAAANLSLVHAQAQLDLLDDSAAMAKLIAGNLAALKTRLAAFPRAFYEDLQAALPGLFVILDRDFEDPANIVRPMFFAIDHGIAAIHLLLDYAMVRVTVPSAPDHIPDLPAGADQAWAVPRAALVSPGACAELGNAARKRLLDRQCVLFELLGTLSWLALREAALLVQEMREDIYEEDALEEINKPGQAQIAIDTQRTRPLLPIFFSIAFKDSRYNGAAALRRLVCHWSFPDGLQELSWKVCHYFSGHERVPATPPESSGQTADPVPAPVAPAAAADHKPLSFSFFRRRHRSPALQHFVVFAAISGRRVQLAREVPAPPLRTSIVLERPPHADRAALVAEVLRFLIAFGIALAGLLSGALDQLSKLDFIPATVAILALGFGANSIKNLLTQPAAPPPIVAKTVPVTRPKI